MTADLYQQQSANKRASWLLAAIFVLLLLLVGLGADFFLLSSGGSGSSYFPTPVMTFAALVVGLLSTAGSYFAGDKIVLSSTRARPANPDDLSEKTLLNVVEEMTIASGLPKPKVYIVPDDDPNAFATGRDPEHASIAVTSGLLKKLNREELQGVIAHEMSHIRNFDIRLMMLIAALLGALVLLSDFATRALWYGGRSGRRDSDQRREGGRDSGSGTPIILAILFVIWLVMVILAPILGQIIAMAVSRRREYLADATGAELTRNPLGLASALRKISGATLPTKSVKRGLAHLCIEDPLGRKVGQRQDFLGDVFATHPPIAERIRRLEEMAYVSHEQPEKEK